VKNFARALLIAGVVAACPAASEVLFHHDFNNEKLHTYTDTDISTTWKAGTGSGLRDNAVKVVRDPDPSGAHGNVMQVFYAGNQYGFHGGSGSQWKTKINGSHDELYFAYDVFFKEDAEFVLGGKLPGLMGGPVTHAGGFPADGTDGWTGRLMWRVDGKIVNYMYHADQPTKYGEEFNWDDAADGQVYLQKGKWNSLEMRYVMNTPGAYDGRLQAWLNGRLVLDRADIMYRKPGGEDVDIDRLLFSTFYGGNDENWAPSTDQYIYFDNFIISTQPITH
jgi:hypothetical protein